MAVQGARGMQLPVWQTQIMLNQQNCMQAAAVGASGIGTTVVGTYGYMAPEQFRGAASPASDLYGLGGTLLFLLSGAPTLPQRLTVGRLTGKVYRPDFSGALRS